MDGNKKPYDWKIKKPSYPGFAAPHCSWATQITAPMPLNAINELFSMGITKTSHPLLPATLNVRGRNFVYVTKDFFQSTPNGIAAAKVTDEFLGFL